MLLRGLKRNWPFIAVVVQLVLIAALSGYLAADAIFPSGTSRGETGGSAAMGG